MFSPVVRLTSLRDRVKDTFKANKGLKMPDAEGDGPQLIDVALVAPRGTMYDTLMLGLVGLAKKQRYGFAILNPEPVTIPLEFTSRL